VYGLYVVDECNIETHGMKPSVGHLASLPEWEGAYLQRLQRMYWRDRNHTCVIAWSLGNEAGYGPVHDVMAAWVRARDPSRVLLYEPASYGSRDCGYEVTGISAPDTSVLTTKKVAAQNESVPLLSPLWQLLASFKQSFRAPASGHSTTRNSRVNSNRSNHASGARSSKKKASTAHAVATDVVCPMYARIEECLRLSHLYPNMPLVQCEYAHMMGTFMCIVRLCAFLGCDRGPQSYLCVSTVVALPAALRG
jgi:beta-galactosidase/beta-glucuronidase